MLDSSNPLTADQNNMTEIFDSNRREWRVVTGGPTISDYGIISLSKLGVYIFGGVHILQGYPTHMSNIYRFNEGKSLKFTWISLLLVGAVCESDQSQSLLGLSTLNDGPFYGSRFKDLKFYCRSVVPSWPTYKVKSNDANR